MSHEDLKDFAERYDLSPDKELGQRALRSAYTLLMIEFLDAHDKPEVREVVRDGVDQLIVSGGGDKVGLLVEMMGTGKFQLEREAGNAKTVAYEIDFSDEAVIVPKSEHEAKMLAGDVAAADLLRSSTPEQVEDNAKELIFELYRQKSLKPWELCALADMMSLAHNLTFNFSPSKRVFNVTRMHARLMGPMVDQRRTKLAKASPYYQAMTKLDDDEVPVKSLRTAAALPTPRSKVYPSKRESERTYIRCLAYMTENVRLVFAGEDQLPDPDTSIEV